jgi:hypothetical protein
MAGGYSVLPFEGYGVYTVWFVQFDPTERNFHLRDVVLKFIYQYNDNVDETDLVEGPTYTETLQPQNGLPTLLDTRYFCTLGTSPEVRAKIRNWAAQSNGDSSLTWPFGTPESDDPNFAKKLAVEESPVAKWLR